MPDAQANSPDACLLHEDDIVMPLPSTGRAREVESQFSESKAMPRFFTRIRHKEDAGRTRLRGHSFGNGRIAVYYPFAISQCLDPSSQRSHKTLVAFFQRVVDALREELRAKHATNGARTICQRMDRQNRRLPQGTKWGREKDIKTWMDAYTKRTSAIKAWISRAPIAIPRQHPSALPE